MPQAVRRPPAAAMSLGLQAAPSRSPILLWPDLLVPSGPQGWGGGLMLASQSVQAGRMTTSFPSGFYYFSVYPGQKAQDEHLEEEKYNL